MMIVHKMVGCLLNEFVVVEFLSIASTVELEIEVLDSR